MELNEKDVGGYGEEDEEEEMMMTDDVPVSKVKYRITKKQVLIPENTYDTARHLVRRSSDGNQESPLLAASLTNHCIQIYRGTRHITTLKGHTKTINGLKFSNTNDNCLFSCSEDGTMRIWDLRQNAQVGKLKDDSDSGRLKPFCSFDVSADDSYACCGTELIREDAFLLFWDLRSSNLLGGYWEYHTDDITGVQFNPQDLSLVASGSTDGLINTFDISQSTEEDALLYTINTDSSADIFRWYSKSYCNIACLTHNETLQLWDGNEACRLTSFSREDTASTFKVDSTIFVTLSSSQSAQLGVVATSSSRTGDIFLLDVEDNKTLVNHGVLSGVYNEPISTAYWDMEGDYVVTCDYSGLLCFWQSDIVDV